MRVEYAPKGLIGVLTPQANTTVEPEYAILTPPGYAWINARLISPHKTIEARLIDYFTNVRSYAPQFANAPIEALSFACTGTSYLVGKDAEDESLSDIGKILNVPAMSAASSVCLALKTLGAKRIGLVSPYPVGEQLDNACSPYWESRGFTIGAKTSAERPGKNFHPIYSLPADAATEALEEVGDAKVDAIIMLGTGMPTMAPIARTPYHRGIPVFSCMFALIWANIVAVDKTEPTAENFHAWLRGNWWRERMGLPAYKG
jgi:maleate isomerase